MHEQGSGVVVIKEAGCRMTFHPDWPLHVETEPEYGAASQHVPGIPNSAVFLHYGPDSTIETYVGAWKKRYGDLASVEEEREIHHHGLRGRYVRLALDEMVTKKAMIPVERGTGVAPEPEVTPAQVLVCTGYTIRQMPVLVGYLFPRDVDVRYFAEAERIISSLRPLD